MKSFYPLASKVLTTTVTRAVGRGVLKARINAPHALFVGGLAGVLTSTVLACRATLKLPDMLDEIQKDVEEAKSLKKESRANYPVEEAGRDLAYVYIRSAGRMVRLYGPAIGFGLAGVGALSGAHINLARRNAALLAAYTSLQASYDAYRSGLSGDAGSDNQLAIRDDVVNDDLALINPQGGSVYARFFDEYSTRWERHSEYNKIFLKNQQSYLNDILRARGHVFLNEVYDRLGLDRTPAGQIVGWLWNSEYDNYIEFDLDNPNNEPFMSGRENSVYLDFNVDGPIQGLI